MYALIGALLALGAPAGLLVLRSFLAGTPPWRLLPDELQREPVLYLYLSISTAIVFAAFGWVLGALFDAQRQEALTDPLTGLPNRRHFQLHLDHAIAHARRTGEGLSLLLLDVDGLKRINDEEGHAAGDRALCAVAAALRSSCRGADVHARISGDEFAVLARGAGIPHALALAERIRAALAARKGAPRVSIGVVCRREPAGLEAHALLQAADGALYEAKSSGRDRVVVARD